MTQEEYETKKRECWEKFCQDNPAYDLPYCQCIYEIAFDRAYAIGKQEKDADTVIQGWVARDQDGYISLFKDKPTRDTCDKDDIPYGFWDEANSNHLELPITSFPDLTWESDPEPVEIIIKRKMKSIKM